MFVDIDGLGSQRRGGQLMSGQQEYQESPQLLSTEDKRSTTAGVYPACLYCTTVHVSSLECSDSIPFVLVYKYNKMWKCS